MIISSSLEVGRQTRSGGESGRGQFSRQDASPGKCQNLCRSPSILWEVRKTRIRAIGTLSFQPPRRQGQIPQAALASGTRPVQLTHKHGRRSGRQDALCTPVWARASCSWEAPLGNIAQWTGHHFQIPRRSSSQLGFPVRAVSDKDLLFAKCCLFGGDQKAMRMESLMLTKGR